MRPRQVTLCCVCVERPATSGPRCHRCASYKQRTGKERPRGLAPGYAKQCLACGDRPATTKGRCIRCYQYWRLSGSTVERPADLLTPEQEDQRALEQWSEWLKVNGPVLDRVVLVVQNETASLAILEDK